MTFLARPCGKRRMDIFLEEFRVLRSVRIMAGPAVHDSGLDIEMGPRKGAAAEVVAVAAQRRDRLRIQRGLLRKMRKVAFLAIARGRGMGLARFQFRLERFMTDEAQIGALRQKEFGELRFVRAVALRALTRRHRCVFALSGGHPLAEVGVTRQTELVLPGRDHSADIACVGVMAGEALSFPERLVVRASDHLFHERAVALLA